jgi:predicted small metal-binding protein
MLEFECKELGTNCNYMAKRATMEEVKTNSMTHAQTAHKEWLAKLSPQQIADVNKTINLKTH